MEPADAEIEDSVQLRRRCPSLEDGDAWSSWRAGPATTAAPTLEAAETLLPRAGQARRVGAGDAPGLVLGRILCQIVNEAHFAVGEGVATPEDVDTAMRLGFNYPRGPFEWAEAIGPARVVSVLDALRVGAGRGALPGGAARSGAPPAHRRRTLDRQPRAGQDQRQAGNRGRGDPLVEQQRSVDDREPGRQVGDDERARRPDRPISV